MLEVNNLSVFYGSLVAVRNLSFKVQRGELVSLLGSNGAGKTTTLRAISGLIRASSGSVHLEGADLLKQRPEDRVSCGVAHVPEGRKVFANMSVWENLALGAYRVGKQSEHDLVLDLFPILVERRNQLAGTLSGGEQQMLAIARALVSSPRLLMMDEPTMGLAPKMIDLILQKIEAIRARGTTILMVEQNAIETIRMSDRVYVLQQGQLVYGGDSATLTLERLKSLYLGHENREASP